MGLNPMYKLTNIWLRQHTRVHARTGPRRHARCAIPRNAKGLLSSVAMPGCGFSFARVCVWLCRDL